MLSTPLLVDLLFVTDVCADVDLLEQLRSCQQALHAVQLQELYGSYTTMAQRTALLIHSAEGAATTICRLCEQHVLVDAMQSHTQVKVRVG